jgi:signal transduction histidine kinase
MLCGSIIPAPAPPPIGEALAILVHELRDPLASIILALEVHSGGGDPVARHALTMAVRQAQQAVRLVDDLFDLCAGTRDSLQEEVELAAVVAGARETTAPLLAARRHRLTVSMPAGPVLLVADPTRIEQVLRNLLANAAKFTEPGGQIELIARVEADQVVLQVRDNGRGIDPALLPRVFDLFWQGSENSGVRGLGLGLALVKSLVELQGAALPHTATAPVRAPSSLFACRRVRGMAVH